MRILLPITIPKIRPFIADQTRNIVVKRRRKYENTASLESQIDRTHLKSTPMNSIKVVIVEDELQYREWIA